MKQKTLKMAMWLLISILSTLGVACLIGIPLEEVTIILYAVFLLLFLFFYKYNWNAKNGKAFWCAAIFTLFIIFGKGWYKNFFVANGIRSAVRYLFASVGILFAFHGFITFLFSKIDGKAQYIRSESIRDARKVKNLFLLCFLALWGIYVVFFLNLYPGAATPDTLSQYAQVLGKRPYSNENPLVNTLIMTLCMKLGVYLFGGINAGVATYTVLQFTMAAAIHAYVISRIYKRGYHIALVVFTFIFYGIVPFNILYAMTTQKDSFFALLFLLLITYLLEVLESGELKARTGLTLLLLAFLCALSRNSGWNSIACLSVVMFIYGIKHSPSMKKISFILWGGVVASLIMTMVVYPAFGISNGPLKSALSVPIQQIGRVVADGKELTETERELLNKTIDVEKVPDLYKAYISDPLKKSLNEEPIKQHPAEYFKLWIKLGTKYPMCYFDAYIALMKDYWDPDSGQYVVANQIEENDLGIQKDKIIFKGHNGGDWYFNLWSGSILNFTCHSGTYFWIIVACLCFSLYRKNRVGAIILCPAFAIYLGLMLTSPVALFRYVYAVIVSIPVILCLPFARSAFEAKKNVNMMESKS